MSVSDKNKDYSVFSRDKVNEVMREIYDLGYVSSKKWSQERFDSAFQNHLRMMAPGKPPRLRNRRR